jgi:toxin ParE1/3/4
MSHYFVTPQAEKDLDQLAQYIAKDNIEAALSLYDMAKITYENLTQTPIIGNAYPSVDSRLDGLLFFPVKNYPKYLIFYVPSDKGITIIRVLHGARRISKLIR